LPEDWGEVEWWSDIVGGIRDSRYGSVDVNVNMSMI